MSTAFTLVFVAAAPFWLLMIFAPTWEWTRRIVSSPWSATPPLVFWFVFAIPMFGELLPAVAKPTLAGWQDLLAEPAALTFAWAQIIAWDLFVGRWMYLDSRERGIHPLVMGPLLVVAIMLSPIAVPAYLILRNVLGRKPENTPTQPDRTAIPV
ncbi:ABA4-like family protein [Actinophytocola sp. NPDC049390]|uniref:ABA4-like family protein n=1 Tax=Actinophytocola sp. NPDC049390 TaxID=3363894 RepID=UPI0037BD957F